MSFIEQNKWCHWVFWRGLLHILQNNYQYLAHPFLCSPASSTRQTSYKTYFIAPSSFDTSHQKKKQSIATKKEAKMKSKVRWKHHQNRQKLSRNIEAKQKKLLQVHWTSWRRRTRKTYVRIVVVSFWCWPKPYLGISSQSRREEGNAPIWLSRCSQLIRITNHVRKSSFHPRNHPT